MEQVNKEQYNPKLNNFYESIYNSTKAQISRIITYFRATNRYKEQRRELKQRLAEIEANYKGDIYPLAMLTKELLLDPKYDDMLETMYKEETSKKNDRLKIQNEEKLVRKIALLFKLFK